MTVMLTFIHEDGRSPPHLGRSTGSKGPKWGLCGGARVGAGLGVLCGWDRPDEGKLIWSAELRAGEGAELPWSELAVVPQALGLVGELSVRENVALPLRPAPRSGRRPSPRAGADRVLALEDGRLEEVAA